MSQSTQARALPKIEIVDQPEENGPQKKRSTRFSLPVILIIAGVSLLGFILAYRRTSQQKSN